MASKKKGKREIVKMDSTESSFSYYTKKNKVNTPDKLELMKYDPILRKKVKFKQTKLPRHSK
jgi:large subunit ribosomal protein L33